MYNEIGFSQTQVSFWKLLRSQIGQCKQKPSRKNQKKMLSLRPEEDDREI